MSKRRPAKQQPATHCGVCTAPVHAAYVCARCMDRYHGHLAAVPDLDAELRIEHTRRAVKGSGVSGRGAAEQPLAWVEAASRAMTELHNALVTACRILALDQPLPAQHVSAVCAWLAEREGSIPLRPEGPDIVAELDAAMQRGWKVCDNPPEKVFIGYCQSPDHNGEKPRMYARRGGQWHTCTCGTRYDVPKSMRILEGELADYRLSFAEVEAATGGRIKADRVRKWTERGHLARTPAGVRFGDVLGVEARMAG